MALPGMGYPTHALFMPKIDLSNYEGGREQAYVKHYLLEKYLSSWGYIIGGSEWDSLVFVDGFAGPWGSKDKEFADASFGIGIRALNEVIDGLFKARQIVVRGLCVFVETKPKPFARLDKFAKENTTERVRAIALRGRFIDNIKAIDAQVATVGKHPFKFVFLDQEGWAATPMERLRPFLHERSCEVLFNLMTSFLTRFVDAKGRESSYNELFGRPGVLEKIRALPKGTGEREEAAVREYCKSLKDICKFRYVSQAIILDPTKEKIRYHLVFATNSLRGIEVFKNAEKETIQTQDELRRDTRIKKTRQPGLFDDGSSRSSMMEQLHHRYSVQAREKVIEVLSSDSRSLLPYDDLFGEAMALPVVSSIDLNDWLEKLPHIEIKPNGPRRKKLRLFMGDRVAVINSQGLRELLTKIRSG
jgi:three-Cys-motif partner protein